MTTIGKPVTVRSGRAFTGSAQWGYVARMTSDGDIAVYDRTAGHYTRCHALTPAQIRYIDRKWKEINQAGGSR